MHAAHALLKNVALLRPGILVLGLVSIWQVRQTQSMRIRDYEVPVVGFSRAAANDKVKATKVPNSTNAQHTQRPRQTQSLAQAPMTGDTIADGNSNRTKDYNHGLPTKVPDSATSSELMRPLWNQSLVEVHAVGKAVSARALSMQEALLQLGRHLKTQASPAMVFLFVLMSALVLWLVCFLLMVTCTGFGDSSIKALNDAELDEVALRLQCKVQKYASSDSKRSMLSLRKERFIAVIPCKDYDIPPGEGKMRTGKWDGGRLAWWQDYETFIRNTEPYGCLSLSHIVNVTAAQMERYERCEALVHYATPEHSHVKKLVLIMTSPNAAKEWAGALNYFVRKVRSCSSPSPSNRTTLLAPLLGTSGDADDSEYDSLPD